MGYTATTKGRGSDRSLSYRFRALTSSHRAQSGLSGPGGLFAFTLSVQVWDERNAVLSAAAAAVDISKHSRRSHVHTYKRVRFVPVASNTAQFLRTMNHLATGSLKSMITVIGLRSERDGCTPD